ncbi:MAG TPA: hypothetical protein VJ011_02760, partial [Steroidobacteraceae bacterium]|nr:hypothetical protein [Steroidobacteraceae bacterium]
MISSTHPLALAALVALAAGCAARRDEPAQQPSKGDPAALTVVAEIALERGECRTASETYLDAAGRGTVTVAKRATEVALQCQQLPVAWKAAQRWRTLAPNDRDAASIAAVVALKLHRIGDARAAIEWLVANAEPAAADTGL